MAVWQRQLINYHSTIGWWFIPNLKAMIPFDENPYLMRTNSVGMRSDREYSLAGPGSHHRIVLLGDSFAAGAGVTNGDRFSDLLEKLHPGLEVLNFGLYGSGTDQQVLIYEALAKKFEADVCLFAPYWSNIHRNLLSLYPFGLHGTASTLYLQKPYFTLEEDQLILHNNPVPNELVAEKEATDRIGIAEGMHWINTLPYKNRIAARLGVSLSKSHSDYDSSSSYSWRLMRGIMNRLLQQLNGKPMIIVPLPDSRHYLSWIAPNYLARFKELHDPARNCFVFDVLPHFAKLSGEERKKCKFRRDVHYPPPAHRVVAGAISDALRRYCPDCLS